MRYFNEMDRLAGFVTMDKKKKEKKTEEEEISLFHLQ